MITTLSMNHQQSLYIEFVLAHSVIFFKREEYNGIQAQACCSDPPAPTVQESTASSMAALIAAMPQLLELSKQQAGPYSQAMFDAQRALAPQTAQQQLDQYQQFGPQFNAMGADITRQNALSQAQTDAAIMSGPGQDLMNQVDAANRRFDPEYYSVRANAGRQQNELLNSFNVNGLSGGERAEVERSLNRDNAARGTLGSPSSTETVKNAMTFGNALQTKQAALSNALNTATQFLPSARSGVDPFQISTGRSSTTNPGDNRMSNFAPTAQNATGDPLSSANGLFSSVAGMQNASMQMNSDRNKGIFKEFASDY